MGMSRMFWLQSTQLFTIKGERSKTILKNSRETLEKLLQLTLLSSKEHCMEERKVLLKRQIKTPRKLVKSNTQIVIIISSFFFDKISIFFNFCVPFTQLKKVTQKYNWWGLYIFLLFVEKWWNSWACFLEEIPLNNCWYFTMMNIC
jgi:hypothetical protein